LPVPKNDDFWWQLLADSKIKIFAKLPFVKSQVSDHELFCVAIKEVEPSQDDITLLYLETKNQLDANQVEEILQQVNFEVECILSQNLAQDLNVFLFEIRGFVSEDDPKLDKLSENDLWANILGYYATQI